MVASIETPVSVLAIDDDLNVLESYRKVLSNQRKQSMYMDRLNSLLDQGGAPSAPEPTHRFDLDVADSGENGLEAIRTKRYAVVLLDMRIPGGWDGLETAIRIRAVDPCVRIVLVTAYMDHSLDEVRQGIGENFAFLQKPYNSLELEQLVLLLGRDWERENRLIEAERSAAADALRAEQAAQAKGDFLAMMSHELRTPLTTLLGNCSLLFDTELDHDQQQLLESMSISGKRLLYQVNDILDSSSIESGHIDLVELEFSPRLLIQEMTTLFGRRAQEAGITFSIEGADQFEKMLVGDVHRLGQVLINLISNAFKFTRQGCVCLRIEVDRAEGQLRLVVSDSGIGIEEEAVSRIFKPFEQADQTISNRFGGTGLGLFISSRLVQLMGGEIEVTSREGEGSEFTVVLPLREGEGLIDESMQPRAKHRRLHLCGNVLIVDDTPELQLLIRRLVEFHGATVGGVACNGIEAIEQLKHQRFDLVLMDMEMPEMNGLEATRELRALNITTPIVAMTANVMQRNRRQFFEIGGDDFLAKPIDREGLRTILQEYLSTADQQQESAALLQPLNSAIDPVVDDELMGIFRKRSVELHHELMDAYHCGDWERVRVAAHTIKGSGSSFGFPRLTETGREVINAVLAGQFERAAKAVDELDRLMSSIR